MYFTHSPTTHLKLAEKLGELTESDYTFDVRYKIRKGSEGGREGGKVTPSWKIVKGRLFEFGNDKRRGSNNAENLLLMSSKMTSMNRFEKSLCHNIRTQTLQSTLYTTQNRLGRVISESYSTALCHCFGKQT